MIFAGRAKVGCASRLRSVPALAIVRAPGMNHDEGGIGSAEMIGHFDYATSIIGKAPGSDLQVGARLGDDCRSFKTGCLSDRFDKLRMVGEERLGIVDWSEM